MTTVRGATTEEDAGGSDPFAEAGRFDRRGLMTPSDVARLFRVKPKTVVRWADEGLLTVIRTPGGHRRFLADEVHRSLRVIMP